MDHKINITWKGEMAFEAETLGGSFAIDAGEENGGKGKGLRPKALMLDALAGCTGLDVASLIKKMHLDVADFQISVEAKLSEEHPKKYTDVHVEYRFTGPNLNKERLQHAIDLSVEKYCGVMAMFRSFANVTIDVKFLN